jgi:multidrug resistance efflux pump
MTPLVGSRVLRGWADSYLRETDLIHIDAGDAATVDVDEQLATNMLEPSTH